MYTDHDDNLMGLKQASEFHRKTDRQIREAALNTAQAIIWAIQEAGLIGFALPQNYCVMQGFALHAAQSNEGEMLLCKYNGAVSLNAEEARPIPIFAINRRAVWRPDEYGSIGLMPTYDIDHQITSEFRSDVQSGLMKEMALHVQSLTQRLTESNTMLLAVSQSVEEQYTQYCEQEARRMGGVAASEFRSSEAASDDLTAPYF